MRKTVLALLLAGPLSAAPGPAPSDPAAAFRQARLTGRVAELTNAGFEAGGGRYLLVSGRAWELAGSGGAVIGFWFEGEGTLRWRAEDENGQKVYAANASRVGGLDVEKDGTVAARFARGTFFCTRALRPALMETFHDGSPASAAAAGKSRARFDADRLPSPEIALAAAGNDDRFFEALLEAGKDVRHRVDEVLEDRETLTVVDKLSGMPFDFPDWRFGSRVGQRPAAGQSRRGPPRIGARLTHVSVDVRETEKNRGAFEVKETWLAERPLRSLCLRLRSEELTERAFRVMPTNVSSVTDESGNAVSFAFEKDRLVLFFPEPLTPGRPSTFTFRYDAGYFERAGGDNYWELMLGGGWYPSPLQQDASMHSWHAVVRAKKPLVPFASGETVRRGEDGEWNLVETKLDRPIPYAMVLAGKYTIQEETRDGVTCRVASYGVAKARGGTKLLNLFHKVRAFYEPYLGAFPFKEYDIVEVNSWGFGQAPPGMMRITREAFESNVYGDTVGEFFSSGINERFAHEIAHAYFGYVVWKADAADQWLEESFAEAAAGRLIEELKDKGEFKRLSNIWRDRARQSSRKAPVFYANELTDKPSAGSDLQRDRFFLVYFKGATLLQAIRKEVGEDAYFTILKSFLRSFEKRPAVTTEQFIALVSYVTKKDWKPWFEKNYYGFEMP